MACQVQEVCGGEKAQTLELFGRVWGAGPATALRWYELGMRTLDDLRARQDLLNRHQEVGLRLFSDLDVRMDRRECTEILQQVKEVALKVMTETDSRFTERKEAPL